MEFDEINTLINIERDKFQNDKTPEETASIKEERPSIIRTVFELEEREALMKAMKCAYKVKFAMDSSGDVKSAMDCLEVAMKNHALLMKKVVAF
uniref:Uncharacterized protein n=1 Tax=viral metagenome TaxID=1070528 RepID=A0A6C0BWG1_9ZZZZ